MRSCALSSLRLAAILTVLSAFQANAAVIGFTGLLDFVDLDEGGAVYSGVATGTRFTGAIDDASFSGFITDGTTRTDFGCCIAAGGIEIANDVLLAQADADRLNTWLGPGFFASGDSVDVLNIEGDVQTGGNGRIEIGLSYILGPDAFQDENAGNYPFDSEDLLLTLFFIFEEDGESDDIYDAVGRVDAVPLPASAWLLLTALLGGLRFARHRRA